MVDSLIHRDRHLSIFRAGNKKTWADSERKEVGPKAAVVVTEHIVHRPPLSWILIYF